MKTKELVFIPAPGMGHLLSTAGIARLLIDREEQLSITVLMMRLPFDTKLATYTKSLSAASTSRLRFVELSQEESLHPKISSTFLYEFIDSHATQVRNFLTDISNSESAELAGVVVDMLCTSMIDAANEFGVPSYVFYTYGASMLGLALNLQSLRDDFSQDVTDYKDSDVELAIPTYINPVPARVLPSVIFDKEGGCNAFLDLAKRHRETKGIIVNTFLELEPNAVQALSMDKTIPPIYTAGPVLNLNGGNAERQKDEMIMKWLDLQPNSSIVFLCFGSIGCFDVDQVKEIAYALERCGHRFLWSLRRPPTEGKIIGFPSEYENLEDVLPDGFLQRTAEVGKVTGWVPQMAVLSHPAVGGFVSHCGWNSILESIWCGVPIATWPIYSEQQVNAFEMVKDLGISVEIKMDYRKDLLTRSADISSADILSADLIEDRIKNLMDPENEISDKVKEMKEKSRLALKAGGSSSASLRCFIDNVIKATP